MKALFCTDGSKISFYALSNLYGYCKNIEIDVLCVIDWHFYPMYMSYPNQDFSNTYEIMSDKVLNFAKEEIVRLGFETGELKKAWGSASEEIIKLSKEDYDLIVMGSNGKKGFQNWLGSVSRQVVNNVLKPIFISKEIMSSKKVLFAIDGSACSDCAVKKAIELLDLKDKDIFLINVMEDTAMLPLEVTTNKDWFEEYLKKRDCFAKNLMHDTKQTFAKYELSVKGEFLLSGSASSRLIEVANAENIDLVVMGSHSKDKFSEFLLGSTSKRVLENAKSSVLIVSKKGIDEIKEKHEL